jgi:hypothetical protein
MEYTFYIKSIEYLENFNNFEKVITKVFYEYKCTYVGGDLYYSNCIMLNEPTENFIEYENISEIDVINWIYDKIDHENIKKEMSVSIYNMLNDISNNPIIVPPPWTPIQSGSSNI